MLFKNVVVLIGVATLCACTTPSREAPAPPPLARARIAGFDSQEIRFLPLEDAAATGEVVAQAFHQETSAGFDTGPHGEYVYNYLALSGGGSNGTFGAGLLTGWSETGDRPQFKIVTGVSVGALIAPFAFLGPEYDEELEAAYIALREGRVLNSRGLLSFFWSEALASAEPLEKFIESSVDESLLNEIAAEHRKGRRLYVASTNLDAEEPVIWDMGAIAASDKPGRLAIFRKVLLASTAVPALFPPVLIDVEVDGAAHQEMHADGAIFLQTFFIGEQADLPAIIRAAHPGFQGRILQNLYVIRNGWITPTFQPVERNSERIAERAIFAMFKVVALGDLWRLFYSARDDEVTFRYFGIPADYVPSTNEPFNPAEMKRMFDYGRTIGRGGIEWQTVPPGYPTSQNTPVP
jgi:hypothetical protein